MKAVLVKKTGCDMITHHVPIPAEGEVLIKGERFDKLCSPSWYSGGWLSGGCSGLSSR